jgi:Arc/MetJ-type ribon-helix-helix transcriptional regulator
MATSSNWSKATSTTTHGFAGKSARDSINSTADEPPHAVDTKQQNSYLCGMTLQLSPEQEGRVAEALRSGAYKSPYDVIDRALEVLHEQDEWLAANRESINAGIYRGIQELDRGEGIPDDELDTHLERLKAQPE